MDNLASSATDRKSLDLGCGSTPKNHFNAEKVYGIDIRDDVDRGIYKADLVIEKIPFGDAYFDFVTAYDFIEHVPRLIYAPQRRYPFVELMNEIWRTLKDGGKFYSMTPAFPQAAAFQDPTHVNIITTATFPLYFCEPYCWASWYGFRGSFSLEPQTWDGSHLISILTKVPAPAGS
jgi:SAM-dependent methyltransferase